MSGKGSNRRPQEAPDEQVADNWARIFGERIPLDSPLCREMSAHKVVHLVALQRSIDEDKAQADHKDVE